ncbi:hypothetical protein Maeo_1244 [Methanococcus aeolicus Nankai-3]|uniref:PIN domain-containing protein n=1 Tax=Methanococcus aeolicus (strain ATCC BAA-1280 / DSM 17508 / OCM 812 / Nankai-3) TaxID=419665 RepID=A6UWE8_META3|nr:hypothetical protein [Methanococcus aeolicus]ABR56820.1 hypothetical protein Maeo_1244 [Methanococcus aeolicus Nankai-3]
MVVKVAVDTNVLGYLGETETTLKKSAKSIKKLNEEINNMENAHAFAKLICSNTQIKGIIPLMVAYEFTQAPKYVKKRVFEKWVDCFHWSNNITIYKRAKSLKLPSTLSHLKQSDMKVVYESSKLGCQYLITFNRTDLRKEKNKRLIKSEFKNKLKISPPEILSPDEFINLLYIPKH